VSHGRHLLVWAVIYVAMVGGAVGLMWLLARWAFP
jgi:hypothetical protein